MKIRIKITALSILTLLFFNASFAQKTVTLEDNNIKVTVENKSGNFTVVEKNSGQIWNPDPWENAAGLLTLLDSKKAKQTVNISNSKKIELTKKDKNTVVITFSNPTFKDGSVAKGVTIQTQLSLNTKTSKLRAEIISYTSSNHKLIDLRYPSRHFSLKTDQDIGAAVIPQKQGIICPSYIFPMNGGRFCKWDDTTYNNKSIGTLELFNNGTGLSMPWWGTYNKKSAVVGIIDNDVRPKLFFNINNNGQYLFNAKGEMSTYQRIQFLDPVWDISKPDQTIGGITYSFIPKGDYVDMAKEYRKEAKKRGHFVSLKDKLARNPDVDKLPGSIYFGIYGGYPHYVNMPGMAFTFDDLKDMITTIHDTLNVDNAFIHAWGTFSNYVPNNWPISDELGGVKKLREAVDLTNKYGYLYSSYHSYSALLENDPDFSTELMWKDANGKLQETNSRWARVDSKYQLGLAKKHITEEIKTLNLKADITDITFAAYREKGKEGRIALAKYIDSLNLVNGTEHGQEAWIPYFDMFEGMTYLESAPLSTISKKAPLFSLVYHDAIATFGKIQDPDNEVTSNGDFRIKALRSILFGRGTTIFFAPYEFEGMFNMIKMANKLVAPIHKETFYAELKSHEYLSSDFKVQRTKFSNGTSVIVNVGNVDQKIENGQIIPGYGYYIIRENGEISKGSFKVSLVQD
ncbi:DUF5696 domain-containing protein [Cellulophaga omnivescoria]|uniref:DUF5696 domain-containing protein n=1 Tax=Cellulophaga omnivescoria TaxID=1888890 RepID=UPI0009872583|nr:DUF5696 domain-containing protein [Cellulophaga omnivescoria]